MDDVRSERTAEIFKTSADFKVSAERYKTIVCALGGSRNGGSSLNFYARLPAFAFLPFFTLHRLLEIDLPARMIVSNFDIYVMTESRLSLNISR